jgi:hypothetical protein
MEIFMKMRKLTCRKSRAITAGLFIALMVALSFGILGSVASEHSVKPNVAVEKKTAGEAKTADKHVVAGGAPSVYVIPASYDFGKAAVGTPEHATLTIHNTGTSDLVIGKIDISTTDTSQFHVRNGSCPSLTPTIKAGESCAIVVTFVPASAGPMNAKLVISSNAPSSPKLDVSFAANGASPEAQKPAAAATNAPAPQPQKPAAAAPTAPAATSAPVPQQKPVPAAAKPAPQPQKPVAAAPTAAPAATPAPAATTAPAQVTPGGGHRGFQFPEENVNAGAATTATPQQKAAPSGANLPAPQLIPAPTAVKPVPQPQKPAAVVPTTAPAVKPAPAPASRQKSAPAEVNQAAAETAPPFSASRNISVKLTADKASPVLAATVGSVTFTANAAGGSGPYEYKFWLKGPSTDNTWKVAQDYSESPTYSWIPSMAGSYVIWVYSRDVSNPAAPEAFAWMPFDLLEDPPVTSVTLTADKTSPALMASVGKVTFTPHAAGGSGKYEYKFWLKGPSTGNVWRVAQDYGISDSFTWAPTQAGHYLIWAYARSAGSTAVREAAAWTSFDVVAIPPTKSVELTADKTSPLPAPAAGVTFTARASGGSGTYEYKFWLKGPSTGNVWKVARDYGVSDTFSWAPAEAGYYSIAVYAKNSGSPAGHEAIDGMTFDIRGK